MPYCSAPRCCCDPRLAWSAGPTPDTFSVALTDAGRTVKVAVLVDQERRSARRAHRRPLRRPARWPRARPLEHARRQLADGPWAPLPDRGPRGLAPARWTVLLDTPLFVGFPGFVSKLWLTRDEHGVYRGLYDWDGAAAAERYARSLRWVLVLVSVRGSIHHLVLPGVRRDELLTDAESSVQHLHHRGRAVRRAAGVGDQVVPPQLVVVVVDARDDGGVEIATRCRQHHLLRAAGDVCLGALAGAEAARRLDHASQAPTGPGCDVVTLLLRSAPIGADTRDFRPCTGESPGSNFRNMNEGQAVRQSDTSNRASRST